MARVAIHGIYVIDLHRNPMAYIFYTTIGRLFLHNRLIREDGALSILRSFTPEEMKEAGQRAGLRDVKVEKHFPSRLILSANTNGILRLSSAMYFENCAKLFLAFFTYPSLFSIC